jgi:hypothetical protein
MQFGKKGSTKGRLTELVELIVNKTNQQAALAYS